MKIQGKFAMQCGGLAIATAVGQWMSTIDCQGALYDRTVDPAQPEFQGPAIYVFWHEYIAFPFYLRGHCHITMLLSQHRDAEWLAQAARHRGFDTVRGSTYRGAGSALRELLQKCPHMNLAITCDGPRGPRRQMAQGAIYLSSKLQLPIVAMGIGYDRPWRLGTWDRFAIPRPYSRGRAIMSPRLQVPPELDRAGIEHYRQRVEGVLTRLSDAAEQWAQTGSRRQGQVPGRPQPMPLQVRRGKQAAAVAPIPPPNAPSPPLSDFPSTLPLRRGA